MNLTSPPSTTQSCERSNAPGIEGVPTRTLRGLAQALHRKQDLRLFHIYVMPRCRGKCVLGQDLPVYCLTSRASNRPVGVRRRGCAECTVLTGRKSSVAHS